MNRCRFCGWSNPDEAAFCEKCGTTLRPSYDVFISYSRKDYVDDVGHVIPDNMLSKIKDTLKANRISYWFDEEGIYSGDEFASVLTRAIRNSSLFLFISSANSNQSKWTSNEISTAMEFKKTIIPFRIDNSPYNDSVMMKIVSLDFIECTTDKKKALIKLLRAVKHHLQTSDDYTKEKFIEIPYEATGATIILDIDGKRTEKIISYNEREVTIKSENTIENFNNPTPSSTNDKRLMNIIKSRKFLWIFITILLASILGGGLTTIFKADEQMPIPLIENDICQAIDLGLPSGTLWGDRNLGAEAPSDYGNLYAWGEIKSKEDYSQYTYVEQLKPTRTITTPQHDAATAELGGDWSMPTEKQFKELLTECNWHWTKINGHNGYDIVGKNGNKIFLPASGWSRDTTIEYQNQYGYYWTCERSSNTQFARSLQFPKDGKGIVGNGYLHYGRNIRAVYVKKR